MWLALSLTLLLANETPAPQQPVGTGSPGSPVTSEAAARPATEIVAEMAREMSAAAAKLHDSVFTLHKREYRGGKLQPLEKSLVKWRRSGDAYLRTLGGDGREVLWRAGGKTMKVKTRFLTLDLAPDNPLVLRSTRHPPSEAGLPFLVDIIARDVERAVANGAKAKVEYLGARIVHREPARCYRAELPKHEDKRYYATVSEVCMNLRTRLPALVRVWDVEDGALRLVEEFGYEGVRVNVGLTDEDFDADNPAYGF